MLKCAFLVLIASLSLWLSSSHYTMNAVMGSIQNAAFMRWLSSFGALACITCSSLLKCAAFDMILISAVEGQEPVLSLLMAMCCTFINAQGGAQEKKRTSLQV
jgi:hypothetical protein